MNTQNLAPFSSDPDPLSAWNASPPGLSKRTVLLAEDHDDLRVVMEHCIVAMGYTVVACADVHIAVAAFRAHARVDLLLTDLEMPGMSGMQLARELTLYQPTLPVLLITGSILTTDTIAELACRGWAYMSKPCSMAALQDTLHRLLSGIEGPYTGPALIPVSQETETN